MRTVRKHTGIGTGKSITFKIGVYLGPSIEKRNVVWKRKSQIEWEQVGAIERNAAEC